MSIAQTVLSFKKNWRIKRLRIPVMMFNLIETGKQREKNECACAEQYIMEKHGEELIRLGLLVYS